MIPGRERAMPRHEHARSPAASLRLVFALLAPGCSATGAPDRGAPFPRVEYRLRYDPALRDAAWEIELRGRGLAEVHGLALVLEDWGEWTRVDDYYLRDLRSDPPLRRDPEDRTRFRVDAPRGWNGDLKLSYEIPAAELGSGAREHHGLLPYRAPTYSLGFSANTLMHAVWDGMPAEFAPAIEISVPPDWTIATGLAPSSRGRLSTVIPASTGNTVISFGRPRSVAASSDPALPIEVVQWGGKEEKASSVLRFADVYLSACTSATGMPPTGPMHLIVTEPGFGGTRVDGAIALGCPTDLDPQEDGGTLHFVAHELFHDWLGGRLRSATDDESLCWFWEGFTDYLSLWELASSGLVSRAWFAERLATCERRANAVKGRDEYAYADPQVPWRDSEVEPLAYQGSALLAFSLDVALRRCGKPGLMALIRHLGASKGGRYELADLRAWIEGQGLPEFWRERFEKPSPHTLREDLVEIGFVPREDDEPIPYLGVQLDREGPFGTVVAVDPSGPAHGIVEPGDQVHGLTPTREDRPSVPPELAAPYRFGLDLYEPKAEQVRVDVMRDGTRQELWVKPRTIAGGRTTRLVPDDARLDRFFEGVAPVR
jgi:hypothetical protein